MAISTYTELQVGVENWLGHTLFTARVPEFIALFEANANRRLRVRQQETSTSLTVSSGAATLPTDFLTVRSLKRTVFPFTDLEYVISGWATAAFPSNVSGTARYYTLTGETLTVYPQEDESLTLNYYAKIPALSGEASGTNWLLTSHPDLYLFGALIEAEAFGVNDTRLSLWRSRRDEIYEQIEGLSNRSRGPGTVRVMANTP